jgi:pimeloyl-ACP methyl ester carboxylesterase
MAVSYRNSFINSTNVRVNKDYKVEAFSKLLSVLWFISKPLTKYLIKAIFFTSRRFQITPVQKQILEDSETFSFVSGKTKVKAWKYGTGPSIVFVHGWSGRGVQFDTFFDAFVKAGYSVIFFDTLGHGESEGKTSSYFQFTDSIADLVKSRKDLNIRGFIAHSFGASAVVNYLSKNEMNVKTILIAPALNLVSMLNKTFEQYGVPLHIFHSVLKEFEVSMGHEFVKENPIDLIKKIKSEILIVHDKNDKAISSQDSKNIRENADNLLLHETKGLGHIRILRDEQTRNLIVNHMKPKMIF